MSAELSIGDLSEGSEAETNAACFRSRRTASNGESLARPSAS